jgi:hypothetical protein
LASPIELVELVPIEYRYSTTKKGRVPAITWFKDLKISKRVNQAAINMIIEKIKTEEKVSTINNPDSLLYWQYPHRPLIIIDLRGKDPTINTTEGTIRHYGIQKCREQAAIVLKILHGHGYADFTRIAISTYRVGETKEERIRNLQFLEERINHKNRKLEGWVE